MSTATMSRTDALEKVEELLKEAREAQATYDKNMSEIRELLNFDESMPQPAHRGRPAATAAAKPEAAKSTPKHAAKKAGANGKVAPSERNYSNPVGLKQTIWEVLDRSPKEWAKILDDFPADAEGLQISEIKEIIEKEGKWKSSSENISTQLSSHLFNLKGEGLIARGTDSRYYIVDGAELTPKQRGRKKAA